LVLRDALVRRCLLNSDGQRGLVGPELLGIADALQVVGECVQDGVLQQLCVDSLRWQLERWLLLLEDGIQRWMDFETI
jgi:hypothetical protein